MKIIYHVCLEPLDNRYTAQWYTAIPRRLLDRIQEEGRDMYLQNIDGDALENKTTAGAFLNFSSTNYYKAIQVEKISELFHKGEIKPGDKFLFTDAWHFGITAVRYMSELLDIPVEIHSIWHAGHYDPSDILGMKMTRYWPADQERAWFHASDFNYFGTNFHKEMFLNNLDLVPWYHKAYRSGQPHYDIIDTIPECISKHKDNTLVWPHRYNADKQPDIIEDLKTIMPYPTVITQKMNLSKLDYYKVLGRAKAAFSCSLHENLGISMMEACLAGAIPVVPDRASYSEMYLPLFKYPSEWTENMDNYHKYRRNIVDFIDNLVLKYDEIAENELEDQAGILERKYLKPTVMFNKLLEE